MKKILLIVLAAVLVAGGACFYGGMKYGQGKSSPRLAQGDFQGVGAAGMGLRGGSTGGTMVSGEIIAQDDKSITVKLQDGGSKIIFYSESTEISKFASGSVSDLTSGKTITVSGTTNSDGSLTAQTIQVRPTVSPAP